MSLPDDYDKEFHVLVRMKIQAPNAMTAELAVRNGMARGFDHSVWAETTSIKARRPDTREPRKVAVKAVKP